VSSDAKTIRVLAADDHALLLQGIASLVNAEPDMALVAQAGTGRDGNGAAVVRPNLDDRVPGNQSRPDEKLPADPPEKFPCKNLPCLVQRQMRASSRAKAINVVVDVASRKARGDPVPILFQVKLCAEGEAATSVVCDEAGSAYHGGWGNLILRAKRKNVPQHRHYARSDSWA